MNKLRLVLADRVEANGGYSRNYESYPIEYDVSVYRADLDRDNIYEVMCKGYGYLPPPTSLEWDEQQQYDWALEDAARSIRDGDDDGYKTYSPATAAKYGLPYYTTPRKYRRKVAGDMCYYPAKKAGWVLDKPYCCEQLDVKFSLAGRGGKHLVVRQFEGVKLNMSAKDLASDIREGGDNGYYGTKYTNQWCVRLLAMMEEWEKCFTPEIASKEVEFQAAYRMHVELGEQAVAWREALKVAREAREVARLADVMAGVLA